MNDLKRKAYDLALYAYSYVEVVIFHVVEFVKKHRK